MRLLDLQRRKSDLLTKEIEQQKLIVQKMQQCTDPEKKKQLYQVTPLYFLFVLNDLHMIYNKYYRCCFINSY